MNVKFLLITSLIVGAATAVLSSIPLVSAVNCLLCGWLWMGGIFGVWLYRKFTNETLTPGKGALLGLVSGVIGGFIVTLISIALSSGGTPIPAEQMQQLKEVMGESAEIFNDPVAMATLTAAIYMITFPLFTTIGGLIGAAIFKPKAAY